jgi:hypothetical protein
LRKLVRRFSYEIHVSSTAVVGLVISILAIFAIPIIASLIIIKTFPQTSMEYIKVYFDVLYDMSGLFLAMTAALALLVAVFQSRESTKIRRSSVILELEDRCSSQGLEQSRVKYQEIVGKFCRMRGISSTSSTENLLRNDIEFQRLRLFMHEELVALLNSENPVENSDYHSVMEVAGFFEYIGFLVGRGYLSVRDANSLFGNACTTYYDVVSVHNQSVENYRGQERRHQQKRLRLRSRARPRRGHRFGKHGKPWNGHVGEDAPTVRQFHCNLPRLSKACIR